MTEDLRTRIQQAFLGCFGGTTLDAVADAMLAAIGPELARAENAEERLSLCRHALLRDGYFTADEIGPDIAPRITERLAKAHEAEEAVKRIRTFLEDMAGWCSPHGVAADYARRGLDALDGVDPFDAIRSKREEQR